MCVSHLCLCMQQRRNKLSDFAAWLLIPVIFSDSLFSSYIPILALIVKVFCPFILTVLLSLPILNPSVRRVSTTYTWDSKAALAWNRLLIVKHLCLGSLWNFSLKRSKHSGWTCSCIWIGSSSVSHSPLCLEGLFDLLHPRKEWHDRLHPEYWAICETAVYHKKHYAYNKTNTA